MRAVINYEAVAEAALAVELDGENPTNERVRERLRAMGFGRGGSATTVQTHLNRWKSARQAAATGARAPVPDTVMLAARQIQASLEEANRLKIEQIEAAARQSVEAAQAQVLAAQQQFEAREREIADLRERLTLSESRKEEALALASGERARREALETELTEARRESAAARAQVDSVLAQTRVSIESVEVRTRSDLAARDERLRELQETLKTLTATAAREREAMDSERATLTRRLDTLVDSLNTAQTRLVDSARALSIQEERARALARQNQQIENALSEARAAEGRWLEEALRLARSLEQIEGEVRLFRSGSSEQGAKVQSLVEQVGALDQFIREFQKKLDDKKGAS